MENQQIQIDTIKLFLSNAFGVKWDSSGNGYQYNTIEKDVINTKSFLDILCENGELKAIIKAKDDCIDGMMQEICKLRSDKKTFETRQSIQDISLKLMQIDGFHDLFRKNCNPYFKSYIDKAQIFKRIIFDIVE